MSVRIKDNTAAVLKAIDDKIEASLGQAGAIVIPPAKAGAPFKTGALRASIHAEVTKDKVIIGSTVPYGPAMEIHQPHLRPALHGKRGAIRKVFEE